MKKIFTIIVLAALTLTAMAQNDVKRVAILETVDKEGTVPYLKRLMFRSNLTTAITNTSGYEGYDRADLSQILGEQDFQRTGLVSDADIKKIGEFTGAKYVLIAEAVIDGNDMFITAKIIDVETARVLRNSNQLMGTSAAEMQNGSIKVAADLLGASNATPARQAAATPSPRSTAPKAPATTPSSAASTTATSKTADGYVDLGLSSGTLWRTQNEVSVMITYEKAMSMYGDNLPSLEQISELLNECVWTWTGNGYNVTGRNNATIFFPADAKKKSGYWSSAPVDLETLVFTNMNAKQQKELKQFYAENGGLSYILQLSSKSAELGTMMGNTPMYVRLVR